MRLTKKKAIEISIELWTYLAETGEQKFEWLEWERYGEMQCDCAFCEYDKRHSNDCEHCPYYEVFGSCESNPWEREAPTIFDNWNSAKTPKARKKYATLFLEQLRRLK